MHSINSGYRVGSSSWWKHWFSLRTYSNWVLFYYQRATRGWADCDTWSLDDYLNEWLPDALRHLKLHTHGFPTSMYTEEEAKIVQPDGTLWPTSLPAGEDADKRAADKWGYILTKIIVGFEANKRMMDGLYENELGPFPIFPINIKERLELEKPLIERDKRLFAEGMALFVQYYNNLWD